MKIGELFKEKTRTVDDIVTEQVTSARKSYPQHAELSDLAVVALLASHRQDAIAERNKVLSTLGRQAQVIVKLEKDLRRLQGAEGDA